MNSTPLHIGIVACCAAGAALCYRTICEERPQLLGSDANCALPTLDSTRLLALAALRRAVA
jgi:hypothetical protein